MNIASDGETPKFIDQGEEEPFDDPRMNEIWESNVEATRDAIGLALSGGGYRATLLSLGVLTYLVDAGLNKRVRTITSVSGGSYANALMALGDKPYHTLDQADRGGFEEEVRALICRLTSTNIWLKPRVLAVGATTTAVAILTWLLSRRPRNGLVRLLVRMAGALGLLAVLDRRGDALTEEIWNTILDPKDRSKSMMALHREAGESSLDHIVCATNIANGKFVYLSGEFLYASGLGWHTLVAPKAHLKPVAGKLKNWRVGRAKKRWEEYENFKEIPVKRAVDGSAALPIVIPPRPFPTGVFEMAGMWFVPPELRLVDGGVYDNLGVQWFRTADLLRRTARRDLKKMGQIPGGVDPKQFMDSVAPPRIFRPDLMIVVNAGGELKWTRNLPFTTLPILREPIPVLTEAMELLRTSKIAFNSSTDRRLYWLRREFRNRFERDHPPDDEEQGTDRPDAERPADEKTSRYDLLEDWKGTVVQIDHSPFVIPQALRGNRSGDVRRRARDARRVLGRIGEDWPKRKHQNAKVPAWPHKMTQESALALMYHGYVSAWANLYTLWAEGDDSPKLDYTEFEKRFECPQQ